MKDAYKVTFIYKPKNVLKAVAKKMVKSKKSVNSLTSSDIKTKIVKVSTRLKGSGISRSKGPSINNIEKSVSLRNKKLEVSESVSSSDSDAE